MLIRTYSYCTSTRHACSPVRPSVGHQSGRSSVTKSGRLPARRSVSPAVRQSGCPLARQPDRHACSQVLPSFGPTTHQPVRPAVRPSVLPSVGPPIQSPANPVSRPLGRQPARPSAHLSGCATSIDGLSATDAGLRRSHLSAHEPEGTAMPNNSFLAGKTATNVPPEGGKER